MDVIQNRASQGLRQNALSELETLAQSVSSVAPTAAPTLLIPVIVGLSGNGTWLAYLLATAATLLVALNISTFARHSASSGSLYSYAVSVFPGAAGRLAGWSLLIAYLATTSAVTGGFTNYANVLLSSGLGLKISNFFLTVLCILASTWVAYRDVKISARLMLWFEAISVTLISLVVAFTLWNTRLHIDLNQLHLHGATSAGLRLGFMLAMFSFVGFESASALGEEAANPRHSIPRAIILSAMLAGVFFILCAYTEVLGFRNIRQDLTKTNSPLRVLAEHAGLRIIGPMIDLGALISFFSCALACITAAARITLAMAQEGLLHSKLAEIHRWNHTPDKAVITAGIVSFIPAAVLVERGANGFEINGWMGSLATYGFITAYVAVSLAAPLHLRRLGQFSIRSAFVSAIAIVALLIALGGSIYPLPPAPYSWLIYLYFGYLAVAFAWSMYRKPDRQQRSLAAQQ